jgi:GPH family glycoside/pentoside/hexuronide:cation symporter
MAMNIRGKAGYGAAEFGLAGGELLLQLYLLEFYIRAAGLAPGLAGLALALAVLWDALTDPLMGGLVDRTRGRFGRFLPYMFTGGLVFGLGLMILFNPPAGAGQSALFWYLLLAYMLVNTGLTLIGVPHIALGGVLSGNTHERTELYGWRLVFGTCGLFAGILAPLLAARIWGADVTTMAGLDLSRGKGSMFMGGAVILAAAVTIAATWRRVVKLPAPAQTFHWRAFARDLVSVLGNPVFQPLFVAFLLVAMARTMNASLALPYYKDSLTLTEAAIQGPILSVFSLSIVLAVPLWVWLGRRFGKKWPACAGMLTLGLLTMLVYPLLPPGRVLGPVIAAVIAGFAAAAIILIESLVTDIADDDFVRHGVDREGVYFGLWRMGQKIARSLTLGITGVLLNGIGYQEALVQQAPATERALAWLFGLGVGGLFIAASLVFARTPIDRARQLEIQQLKVRLCPTMQRRDLELSPK